MRKTMFAIHIMCILLYRYVDAFCDIIYVFIQTRIETHTRTKWAYRHFRLLSFSESIFEMHKLTVQNGLLLMVMTVFDGHDGFDGYDGYDGHDDHDSILVH